MTPPRRVVQGYAKGNVPDTTSRTAPLSLFQGGRPGWCRVCRRKVLGGNGRGRWHPACAQLFRALRNPQELRKLVLQRDHGVCSGCKLDALAVEKVVAHWRTHKLRKVKALVGKFHEATQVHDGRVTYWDADHVKRVADGGGLSALLNVRTLCCWCHSKRTHGGDRPTGKELVPLILDGLIVESAHILHDHEGKK